MRVVAFTGLPGAGKSEAVEVARQRGFPVVRMGDFVWEETRARGLELVDVNVGAVATDMRKRHGMDYWARRTCDVILDRHASAPLVVVDGVRTHEEVQHLRRRLGDRFELVAVGAPGPARVDRLLKRRRPDDAESPEAVEARDAREKGWGIESAMALADHRVENVADLPAFRRAVSELLDRLLA